ncbi:hypothetical protein Hanom_Chr14g01280621 [Helianthus anomalus]|nr:hypothetical protein HanPSC8_Chr17g0762561 [Helianthus annuus]
MIISIYISIYHLFAFFLLDMIGDLKCLVPTLLSEYHGTRSRLYTSNRHYIRKCCTPVQYNNAGTRLGFRKFN